jgi:hypothetical protein
MLPTQVSSGFCRRGDPMEVISGCILFFLGGILHATTSGLLLQHTSPCIKAVFLLFLNVTSVFLFSTAVFLKTVETSFYFPKIMSSMPQLLRCVRVLNST